MPENPNLLAVLIDADNMPSKFAKVIFDEIATLGEAAVRRIYGDFSNGCPQGWTPDILAHHAILPHQRFAAASKKNAWDIALVIDAMDLLHSGRFAGFVLVSSDSDFTGLAARIREQGLNAFGIGEAKTPDPLRRSYKRFIQVENLGPNGRADSPPKAPPSSARPLLNLAIQAADMDTKWIPLSRLGSQINASDPTFDPRAYGCPNLSTLVREAGGFEVMDGGGTLQVRRKTVSA